MISAKAHAIALSSFVYEDKQAQRFSGERDEEQAQKGAHKKVHNQESSSEYEEANKGPTLPSPPLDRAPPVA